MINRKPSLQKSSLNRQPVGIRAAIIGAVSLLVVAFISFCFDLILHELPQKPQQIILLLPTNRPTSTVVMPPTSTETSHPVPVTVIPPYSTVTAHPIVMNPELVLWDISHGSWGTTVSYTASARYSQLIRTLERNNFNFDINDTGILDLNLSRYQVIMLNAETGAYYQPYSDEEARKIRDYVAAGGGLILMSDNPCCTAYQHLNPVGFLFGISLANPPENDGPNQFSQHPIFTGVNSIVFDDGGALTVSAPALAVAWNSSDIDIAVAEYGAGRVVAIGDTDVWTDNYIQGSNDNLLFAVNTFNWISKRIP